MIRNGMAHSRQFGRTAMRLSLLLVAATFLTACDDSGKISFGPKDANVDADGNVTAAKSVKLVERDTEAPDIFQFTGKGLWDGRPSLGGVWVAHPDVKDPERVIIRNKKNGKFVIGALFRREREIPGPKLQVSSDAAATLGMLAGQPADVNVTALRREEVPEAGPAPETAPQLDAPGAISETALDPVTSAAAAALSDAPSKPAPKPQTPATSGLSKPYIQLGIFSVEQNANNTAQAMRVAGMVPSVRKSSSSGKVFWRVLVGPAQTSAERAELMKKIKASGFSDAYAVSK